MSNCWPSWIVVAAPAPSEPPRRQAGAHALSYLPQVAADLERLDRIGPELASAAIAVLDDLAHGRQRGKVLGDRNITGDLTGLARLRFDRPGGRPMRFRIVYRLIDDGAVAEVVAIGERGGHAVYREALARLGANSPG